MFKLKETVTSDLILKGNKQKKWAGSRRNTEGKKVENNLFSVEDCFFNMNYIEHFSQHYEELRETGDNLTKVFVPRWSHCMLTNKNLVYCGYPTGELAANLTLNGL